MTFNLLDEPWIPVLRNNGRMDCVGIKESLIDAASIREIATSNPMDRIAILRFLLAILYWCKGGPPKPSEGGCTDCFPEAWFSKLDINRDHFNLLGAGPRFYQDSCANRLRASSDLLQEIPTGNNFWHFRHSVDKQDGLCPACCAMGLLRLPLFSVSGLPDLKAGINGTPPIYVIPCGLSLLETLHANWVPRENLGVPSWMRPDIRPVPDEDVPLLTGLTLLSRRVWLAEPSGRGGVCNRCGAKRPLLIRTCEFQTAGDQRNHLWDDPHVVYREQARKQTSGAARKAETAVDLTAAGKFRMDRPWPRLVALLLETRKLEPRPKPMFLLVVGFATEKAKNIDVWERTIDVPTTGSIHESMPFLVREWEKAGDRMRFGRSKSVSAAAVAAIRPHVEHIISLKLSDLIVGSDTEWRQATDEYAQLTRMMAVSLSPGVTTEAVGKRRAIAAVLPRVKEKTRPASSKKPVTGGDK